MVELWQLIGWRVKTWELLGVTPRNGRLAALFLCRAEWHKTTAEEGWNGCFGAYLGDYAPYMRMDDGQTAAKAACMATRGCETDASAATYSCWSRGTRVLNGVLNGTRTNDKKRGKNGALLVFQTTPKNSKKMGLGLLLGLLLGLHLGLLFVQA